MEHPSFGERRFIPCQLVASAPVSVFGEEDRLFGERHRQYPIGRGNGDYARGYFLVDSLSLRVGRAFNGSDSPPSTQRTSGGSWRTHVGKYVDIYSMCSIPRDFRLHIPGDGAVVFDAGGRIMGRIIKSELYKLKHTWILWIHLVLPVLYALVFYLASQTTGLKKISPDETIQVYFMLLGAALPIVFGILTYKVADMESRAGHFQLLLSTIPSRTKTYLGKMGALFLGFLLAASVAVGLFGWLFGHRTFAVWFTALILLLLGSVAVYLIHLWVALALGSVPSLGLGFVETLIALLAMTGLGDKLWYFLPCTWPARLPGTYILGSTWQNQSLLIGEMARWGFSALPISAGVFIGSLIWFNRWEPRSWGE